ncbi:DUF6204 family protein [Streptomyces sp. NPDC002990]
MRRAWEDHGVLSARFTEDGTLTYESGLHGFTFRLLVPASDPTTARVGTA